MSRGSAGAGLVDEITIRRSEGVRPSEIAVATPVTWPAGGALVVGGPTSMPTGTFLGPACSIAATEPRVREHTLAPQWSPNGLAVARHGMRPTIWAVA